MNDCVHFLDTETEQRGENEVPVSPCEHAADMMMKFHFLFRDCPP